MNRAQLPHTYKRPNEARLPLVYDCGIRNAGTAQPYQCTLARIDFHRKGDETEQRSHGKQMIPASSNCGKVFSIRIPPNSTHVIMLEANETTGTSLLRIVSGA